MKKLNFIYTADDVKLGIDDKWPHTFIHSFGDDFSCVISIDYDIESVFEKTSTPLGMWKRDHIRVTKVNAISILVNDSPVDKKIHNKLCPAIKTKVFNDPEFLLRFAENEMSKDY